MAVSPREAAKLNDESEIKCVELMEQHIDVRLKKQFRTGMSVSIYASTLRKLPGFTQRAQEEVFKRFRGAGWNITKGSVPDRLGSETVYEFSELKNASLNY